MLGHGFLPGVTGSHRRAGSSESPGLAWQTAGTSLPFLRGVGCGVLSQGPLRLRPPSLFPTCPLSHVVVLPLFPSAYSCLALPRGVVLPSGVGGKPPGESEEESTAQSASLLSLPSVPESATAHLSTEAQPVWSGWLRLLFPRMKGEEGTPFTHPPPPTSEPGHTFSLSGSEQWPFSGQRTLPSAILVE